MAVVVVDVMARPRIFATGVYGSDFDVWGAQSFSDRKTRDKLGKLIGPDDYVLTIGMTKKGHVPEHEQGRLLALTKIGSEPIMTPDLVHPDKWKESLARYGERWMYGFPVRAVERFNDLPPRWLVLPRIGRDNLYMALARYFVEVTPDEVDRVLALSRTSDTNIYTTAVSAFAARLQNSRRGPKPSRKTRTLSPRSGPAATYCLELLGTLAQSMREALRLSPRDKLFKIGFSTNVDRRIHTINNYLPCEDALCWKLVKAQWHEDEINAWVLEQRIFDLLKDRGVGPLKGEIVSLSRDALEQTWGEALLSASRPTQPVIIDVD